MNKLDNITLLRQDETRSYYSDGTSLLRVRGGDGAEGASDGGDPQGAAVAALEGAGGPQNGQQGGGQGHQAQPQGELAGLAEGFLERVDPAHRSIVQPYVKQWDAGVTRRFQELHGQLEPYQQLGDPDQLSQAKQLYDMIDQDPQRVLEILQEAVGSDPSQGQPGQEQSQQGVEPGQETPGLPPEVMQQLDTMQNVLEALAQKSLDQESSQEAQQMDQELDDYFGLLKDEFGEFDEDFVVAKMLAGQSGEEAVQAYNAAVQGQVNQRAQAPNVPPIMGGGGAIPQEAQSISKADSKDVKNLVANILAQSQG